MDTGTGVTGISDTMSPGDISSLSESNAVAFRVTFDDFVPEPRDRYWRGLVLSVFNGRTWTQNDPNEGPFGVVERVIPSGDSVSYQITLEPTHQPWIFALDMPWTWSERNFFMGPQKQLARSRPVDQRLAYKATSYLEYRTDVGDSHDRFRGFYQSVPPQTNTRTQQLARGMRADAGSDRAYIEAVLMKFHQEEYYYTLEPPPLGSNPVDRFLFDTQRGFCEHYASAFAVMMRAAGIPARVVLGYQGGELNPIGGHMIVRQSDAHAWNEVWLEGTGWYRVDPTAAVAPDRIESGVSGSLLDGAALAWGLSASSELWHKLTLTWDAMNAKWNDWVLGYGPENQERFMEWLGMDDPDWRKMIWTLLISVTAMILLISFLLALRYRAPKRDRAAILYERFVRKVGVDRLTGETPAMFAARAQMKSAIPADTINEVTTTYLNARYGPADPIALHRLESAVAAMPRQ